MKLRISPAPKDSNWEMSVLIETLLQTGRRLEALTGGEVDTVTDPEGRILMMRGTQAQLRLREVARQAAILNALPFHIALLDDRGFIISVNEAWKRSNSLSETQGSTCQVGVNYLEICDRVSGVGSSEARLTAEGIRAVLAGRKKTFSIEYPSFSTADKHWFQLTVAHIENELSSGAVIILQDITQRKQAEFAYQKLTQRLSLATEVGKVGVWEWNLAGNELTWDRTMFEIYGFSSQVPITYEQWTKRVHPEDLTAIEATIQKAIDKKKQTSGEFRIILPNGEVRTISALMRLVVDINSTVIRLIGVNLDISERKEAEEALFKEKELAQVTLNSIGDAVICTDVMGDITFHNPIAEKMTGRVRDEIMGFPLGEVFRILDGTTREAVRCSRPVAVGGKLDLHLPSDSILLRHDGLEIPIEETVAPIHNRDGRITGAVIIFRDISAAKAKTLHLTHSAQHDYLTSLPNRMLLQDRLGQAIVLAKRHSKKAAVLFLDLDGFKEINDSLGHPVGDKLLQSVALRLVNCVRGSDTVSRQGGDEFVVLLAEMEHPEDAAITAARMLDELAKAHSVDTHSLEVSASIGVSVYPEDGLDAETLIKNADMAMYQAKENGRKSYRFFKSSMNTRAVERQSIEANLRRALEKEEFALHFQPKIKVSTGEITGAEALLRWTHPTQGPISPSRFMAVAEDSKLILPIGKWVFREACKQARAWQDSGLPLGTLAVNVSAMEFRNDRFPEEVLEILEETGLDPKILELEFTENILMTRIESVESVLRKLRAAGMHLAVHDFGTGYSSLTSLTRFPIDTIKIDRSFVRQITAAQDDSSMVRAIIGMGQSLNLRVIAEGVETREELEFLRAYHCNEAQGGYFSSPLPARPFAMLLKSGLPEAMVSESILKMRSE